jgi:hypothetical protein
MIVIKRNYTIKILILFLATFASIFAIWYALMREQSVDWLSSQIAHQISPYTITENEDGFFIDNMLLGYGFSLPEGFRTNGAKNLVLFIDEAGQKKCEIKHFYINADKDNGLAASETTLIIPFHQQKLVFELVNKTDQDVCIEYLDEISRSVINNE